MCTFELGNEGVAPCWSVPGLAVLEKSVCFSSVHRVLKTDVFLIFVQPVFWCCVLPRAQPCAVVLGCSHFENSLVPSWLWGSAGGDGEVRGPWAPGMLVGGTVLNSLSNPLLSGVLACTSLSTSHLPLLTGWGSRGSPG